MVIFMDYTDGFGIAFAALGIWMLFVLAILIAAYVVSSLGWMKLYKKAGYEPAWAAWVPFLSNYALGMYLQDELGEKPAIGYILAFYWVAAFIPIIGGFVVFAGSVFLLVEECRWIAKREGGVPGYLLLFLFPIALPFLMAKTYD